MLTQLDRPSTRAMVLAVGLLLAAIGGLRFAIGGDGDTVGETGSLEVAGEVYRFRPTTCTITETDFLAAGPGEIDGEDFWLSASPDGVSLALGTSDEVARSGTDLLWLMSVGDVRWSAVDGSITAALVLRDQGDTRSAQVPGSLAVDCPSG